MTNYYAILGVSSTASASEIKRAYRRLARLHHPDLHAQAQEEQIKRLNEAYEVLSNAEKRRAYDEQRRLARQYAEALRRQQEEARRKEEEATREPKMTWMQGVFGFVRELRKEMRDN